MDFNETRALVTGSFVWHRRGVRARAREQGRGSGSDRPHRSPSSRNSPEELRSRHPDRSVEILPTDLSAPGSLRARRRRARAARASDRRADQQRRRRLVRAAARGRRRPDLSRGAAERHRAYGAHDRADARHDRARPWRDRQRRIDARSSRPVHVGIRRHEGLCAVVHGGAWAETRGTGVASRPCVPVHGHSLRRRGETPRGAAAWLPSRSSGGFPA